MSVEIKDLRVSFGQVQALKGISFSAESGEFLVILGPSGCGKTTALRCIAGLLEPTSGEVYIDGKRMNGVYPSDRNISMVFQNYALYPHMTVYDNIALNMKMKKLPKEVIDRKVREVASVLQISELLNKRPRQLSGGQAQRVGLARAMVREPSAFLMDEPLSNLDAKLRNEMRDEMKRFQRLTKKSIIYVTHDQIEAMTLGDRIVVMNGGKVIQVARPKELFDDPAHMFVAGFLGNPPMNLVPARLAKERPGAYAASFEDSDGGDLIIESAKGNLPASVMLGFRPTDLEVDEAGKIEGRLSYAELLGAEMNVHFGIGSKNCVARLLRASSNEHLLESGQGEKVRFSLVRERLFVFDPVSGERIRTDADGVIT